MTALAKRLAELVDGDEWAMADLLVEEFPPDQYGEAGSSVRSDLHAALEDCEDELRAEYGIELKVATMRIHRATALAWPRDTRASRASFRVHSLLRGEDRQARMDRYFRLNKGRPLSDRVVRRFRADENPKLPVPWDVGMRKALESTARRFLLPGNIVTDRADWWNASAVGEDARAAVVDALRALAKRINNT